VIDAPPCGIAGPPPTHGVSLSDKGEVVGYYGQCLSGNDEAFYWSEATGMITLDRPPGVYSAEARGLNPSGTIVGTYARSGVGFRGFVYLNGEWTELSPLNLDGWSFAYGISAGGDVVGQRSIGSEGDPINPHQGFIWSEQTGFVDLGVMAGPNSAATAISPSGLVAGWTGPSAFTGGEGFLLDAGKLTFLVAIPDGVGSGPLEVNDIGVVVGAGQVPMDGFPYGVLRAFRWEAGEFTMLGTLADHLFSRAEEISADGETILGDSWYSKSDPDADGVFLWRDGVMWDLNGLVPDLQGMEIRSVGDINSSGVIVASAAINQHLLTVLLAPIPSMAGDLNSDCMVGTDDLALLLDSWGPCGECAADLDSSGSVGPLDLAILLANWD
jgi:uncharacterized membrane protein